MTFGLGGAGISCRCAAAARRRKWFLTTCWYEGRKLLSTVQTATVRNWWWLVETLVETLVEALVEALLTSLRHGRMGSKTNASSTLATCYTATTKTFEDKKSEI